jgi:AcrR family transcriptional regulator
MERKKYQVARQARRERRIEHRREEILEAAAQVFADKGYDSTTTRDIAEAVDMGESTLYNYFQNKRDILLAIIDLKRAEMDEFLGRIDQVKDREGLIQLIDQAMVIWLSRANFTRTMIGEAWRDAEIFAMLQNRLERLFTLIKEFLDRHLEAGHFRPIQTDLTARMILGMFIAIQLPALFVSQATVTPAERRQNAEAMTDLLLMGIEDHLHPETR